MENQQDLPSNESHSECAHPAYKQVRKVTDFASVVLCSNSGVMELDGTNTWLLKAPDAEEFVVIDPGPKGHKDHLKLIAAQGKIALTLITHRHYDHTGSLRKYNKLVSAPVRAFSDEFCAHGGERLHDREVIEIAGLTLTVLHTPGHTADSISILVLCGEERAILTGDTVLGTGTSVLDPRDGGLRDYLDSINRIIIEGEGCVLLPGHGPDHPDVIPVARFYKHHREERLMQVKKAIAELGLTVENAKPMKIVRRVYADVDKRLWPAARLSVKAQLAYLRGN